VKGIALRVIITAPYLLPVIEHYRPLFENAGAELVLPPVRERLIEAELLPLVKEIDGAICGDDQFTKQVLRNAPRLRVISKWGTGVDSIDIAAANELGIQVCNTTDAFTDAVADTALGYVLNFARGLLQMDRDVRGHHWRKPQLKALHECTLGIVGVGHIGSAVARRARAFGMQVLGNDRITIDPASVIAHGLTMTTLPDLLKAADFVSLHCDLNESSFHLIGSDELKLMKSSAFLINTSRGAVVNESALVEALSGGVICGAALDVFETEPLPHDSPLRTLPNCLLAPHNANSSYAAWQRVHRLTIENLLNVLQKDR
jgi:D-3-phosphoglycerate dehydrogenase